MESDKYFCIETWSFINISADVSLLFRNTNRLSFCDLIKKENCGTNEPPIAADFVPQPIAKGYFFITDSLFFMCLC